MGTDHERIRFLKLLADIYLQHNQVEKAVVLLEALRVLQAEDPELLKLLGYALLVARRFDDALEATGQYLRLAGEGAEPVMHLVQAQCYWAIGHEPEARTSLERFVERRPQV